MVSSGTVTSDASSLSKTLTSCKSEVSGLSGSWNGSSHDNLVSQFDSFYGEASSIEKGLTSFAQAVDLYDQYLKIKKEKEEAQSNYKKAKNNYNDCDSDDSNRSTYRSQMNTYSNKVDECETKLKTLKTQINSALNSAKGSCKMLSAAEVSKIASLTEGQRIDGFSYSSNIIRSDGKYILKNDPEKAFDVYGGQLDSNGNYPKDKSGCDNYARGYAIYVTNGKTVDYADVCFSGGGLTEKSSNLNSSKEQAQFGYDKLMKEGRPAVFHLNSPTGGSGKGHWVTVVGVKDTANRETVEIGDFIALDPSTGTMRPLSDDPAYCTGDKNRCSCDNGYQVITYE